MGNNQVIFEKLKRFFALNLKIKETILKLAPTELDDVSEKSRIEYTDKLYKQLKGLELEFNEMAESIGIDSSIVKSKRCLLNRKI